jgi:hypothetical protein
MLPDPARYEARYRLTGAALGLASALLAIGLGFLWHTDLIFAALTVLAAIPAVLVIARRPVAFRADHAGITRRIKNWQLDREQLAAVTAAVAPGIPVIEARDGPGRGIEGPGQRQDRLPR